MSISDKTCLLLSGLAAGDSLGATSEFVTAEGLADVYNAHKSEGWPFKQVGGGRLQWSAGDPTDDTDMAMCMLRSYAKRKGFDGCDLANEFVKWLNSNPRDIGIQTSRILTSLVRGTQWNQAGLEYWRGNPDGLANGSLMRNGIVPGLANSLLDTFRISILHGLITHYAPLCQLCCAAHSWLTWNLLAGNRDRAISRNWIGVFRDEFDQWLADCDDIHVKEWANNVLGYLPAAWDKLSQADWDPSSFNPYNVSYLNRGGYVLLTLQIGVWALNWSLSDSPFHAPDYLPSSVFQRRGAWVLGWVAMIGEDSDTYGATAGPLIAAAHGTIPIELTNGLRALQEYAALS